MNSDATIADRMQKAGLPYEMTGNETPMFLFSGGSGVVAIWKDSRNDNERAFVGFYGDDEYEEAARAARKVKGVHSVYFVDAQRFGD